MTATVFVLPTPEPDEPAEFVAAVGHYEAGQRYMAAAEAGGDDRLANILLAQASYTAGVLASDLEGQGLLQ